MENYKPARWLRIVMIFAGLAALAIAGAYFLAVVLAAWKGEPWAWIVFIGNPVRHTMYGLAFLLAAYFLLRGYSHDWNIFFMHPSPEGHHLLATYLEQALAEHGWLNPKG